MGSEDEAVFFFFFLFFIVAFKALIVGLLNFFVIKIGWLSFFLEIIVLNFAHNLYILNYGACFFSHGGGFSLNNWYGVFFLERWTRYHFSEIAHINVTQRLENSLLVFLFWALLCKWVRTTGKRTHFAIWQKRISVGQLVLFTQLNHSLNAETNRSVCVMKDSVLWDFTYCMVFIVGEVFDLGEKDVFGLVFTDFVVGLKDFVLDFDFL